MTKKVVLDTTDNYLNVSYKVRNDIFITKLFPSVHREAEHGAPSLDTGNLSSDLQESHGHATRAWYTRPPCHGQQGNFFALLLSYMVLWPVLA